VVCLNFTVLESLCIICCQLRSAYLVSSFVPAIHHYFVKERATDAEVAEFAKSANFPAPPKGILMSKGMVNGDSARPAWKLLKEATGAPDPTWNFAGNMSSHTYFDESTKAIKRNEIK